ncbi:hypothetical protein GCM10009119_24460 [Algoriphagus jejuensis]|uniref:YXWGXW repeat-containing protein n=1 Tax=Algoriphagus jejuensis TaxID=419934 RepID=A0ABN1N0W6_9BACT
MNTQIITRWLGTLALGVVLLAGIVAPQHADAKNYMGVSFQVFYDELSPYGDWVKDARYGYIWLPAVRQDFHPYGSDGHWVMTEYGNTWVSNYDWGWAPFHYGRWYFDDYFQSWAWIPGYDWGPAWVNWRTGGGYYGWAPLGPGVSINVSVNLPSFHWVFIPNHRIYHQHAYRYYAPYKTKVKVYNNTTIINNTVVYNNHNYVGGPKRSDVERVTRNLVPVYSIQASKAPGRAAISKNSVNLYRPEVQQSRGRTTELKPSRVLDAQTTKTERSSRELTPTAPSRVSTPVQSSSGRTIDTPSRSSQSSTKPATRQTPSRSVIPSGKEGSKNPTVTPAPSQSQKRGTTTTPSATQSFGSREATPSRSTEVRKEPSRTQQSAPSRGTIRQSSPAQAPARVQSSEVMRSEPAKTRVSEPTRSSAPARTSTPEKKSTTETKGRTSSSTSGRTSSSGRNN